MELTALTSTKELLGASYGKTGRAGDASSSAFSDLLPAERQVADRRDAPKDDGFKDSFKDNRPAAERDSAPYHDNTPTTETTKAEPRDDNREQVTRGYEERAAEPPVSRRNGNEGRADQQPTVETPTAERAEHPNTEPARPATTTENNGQRGTPTSNTPEAAATGTTAQPTAPQTQTPAGPANGGPASPSATTAALVATLTGTQAPPATPAPTNQAAPTNPTEPPSAANPIPATGSAAQAAAAYAAIQPQPQAAAVQSPASVDVAPSQPAAPAASPHPVAPAPPATAITAPDKPSAPSAPPAPVSAPNGQAAITTPNTPATPVAAPTGTQIPVATPPEQPTAQVVDALVRAGGETARRPRGGMVPGQTPAAGSPAHQLAGAPARNGTRQPPAPVAPTGPQTNAVSTAPSSTAQNQPTVTIAAATIAPGQAGDSQSATTSDSSRLTIDSGRPSVALADQSGTTVIKTTEPQTVTTTRGARAANTVPASEQVAVRIQKAVAAGTDRIEVQLKPTSLGRVNIALEFAHDGRVLAVVTADSPDTLDMLKQDARSLERALQDAGLKADSGSLSFNLRGNGENSAKADGFAGGADRGEAGDDAADDAAPTEIPAGMIAGSGLLDIHV